MKYSLGLDIGTTSIGWAVIDEDKKRIHDVGVRIFEKPEDPQSGKSLAEPRRMARSTRRRLRRRRQRLDTLKRFFVTHGLLTNEMIEKLLTPNNAYNPYEIRERATKEVVSNQELFMALYHIAKRRGYKSNRRALEEKDTEGSKVLSAISDNAKILQSFNTKSVAAALNKHEKFVDHKRNKRNDYTNSFVRQNFENEAKAILQTQKELGLQLSDEHIQALLYGDEKHGDFSAIFSQRPFMTSELIEKMRGVCECEPREPRAAKASYSFELFRLAQNLAHLRIVMNGETRGLTAGEIAEVVEKAKNIKTLKYAHIRDMLGYKNDPAFGFAQGMIRGKIKKDDASGGENNKFDELAFYHAVKKALEASPKDWAKVESDQIMFDEVGYVLTANKDDESLRKNLAQLGLGEQSINELLKLNFNGFVHLSLKALRGITPFLLNAKTYDDAVKEAGYRFSQKLSGDKPMLPSLSMQDAELITNPVAKRAISQAIKVVNAVIRKYGTPNKIKVEAASDLAKNFSDRLKIEKAQKENAEFNEDIKNRLQTEFNIASVTGLQITKFKLYKQQNGKCMYSGKPLSLDQLFADERYAEIDHIIPFSRCGNDGLNNKALVLTSENQNKGNLTPYEAWGSDEGKWKDLETRVKATFLPFAKKDRLLAKSKPVEEWNVRALNDTRYISKFLRRYIRENLQFAKFDDEKGVQRVISPSGPITSYLRRVWRVGGKNRDENNLHHATDACIIAAIDHAAIQKVSRLNVYYELFQGIDKNEITDKITGEILHRSELEQHIEDIQPWEDFGKEVRKRTALYRTPVELQNELIGLANYDDGFRLGVKPIFVSRMPKRGGKGPVNKETIRSPKIVDDYENSKGEKVVARKQRVPLAAVNLKALYDSPIRETDPKLYELLRQRLEEHGNDPKKAFADKVYKPTRTGERGNVIRSIKVYDTQNAKSGFYINGGKAFVNNGSTIRLDVYKRKNFKDEDEYYFTPIYTHLIHAKRAEILPTPNGRSAAEKADFDTLRDGDGKIYATAENGFEKQFSIYPNDYIRIYAKNKIVEGYYVKYNSSDGSLKLTSHISTSKGDLDLISIAAKTAHDIQRFDISILGDNYIWM